MEATISVEEAERETWDCLILGAGPAGATLAQQLAARAKRVLLVEAKAFPRDKVCGGCLNGRAQQLLAAAGLTEAVLATDPRPLDFLQLACRGRTTLWRLPHAYWSVRRRDMDLALVKAAVQAGAHFLSSVTGRVHPEESADWRKVSLRSSQPNDGEVAARVVVAADGLLHTSLMDLPEFRSQIHMRSRVGIQTTLPAKSRSSPSDPLVMAVGQAGYVGMAPLSNGELQVAAAIDPSRLADSSKLGDAVLDILREAGIDGPRELVMASWSGTPPLTRRSATVAAARLFLLGDAIGYVEPFTGEGMAWAIASAMELTPLALAASERWDPAMTLRWQSFVVRQIELKQKFCRIVTELLRYPRMAQAALACCDRIPPLRNYLLRQSSGMAARSTGNA